MFAQKGCSSFYRGMARVIVSTRVVKHPALCLVCDQRFFVFRLRNAGSGKHAAIVSSTGPRTMRVYGALVIDQHRTTPMLVITHQHVAFWLSGSREQQLLRDSGKCFRLFALYVNELT